MKPLYPDTSLDFKAQKEDLRKRTKISKTVVETLSNHGSLNDMSEKNQLSLF